MNGTPRSISSILTEIKNKWKANRIRGVTITGGDPFQQVEALSQLVKGIKKIGKIGIIILFGYEEKELVNNLLKNFTIY